MKSQQKVKTNKVLNPKKESKSQTKNTKPNTNLPIQSELGDNLPVVKYTLINGNMEELTSAFQKKITLNDQEEEKVTEPSPFGK